MLLGCDGHLPFFQVIKKKALSGLVFGSPQFFQYQVADGSIGIFDQAKESLYDIIIHCHQFLNRLFSHVSRRVSEHLKEHLDVCLSI